MSDQRIDRAFRLSDVGSIGSKRANGSNVTFHPQRRSTVEGSRHRWETKSLLSRTEIVNANTSSATEVIIHILTSSLQ